MLLANKNYSIGKKRSFCRFDPRSPSSATVGNVIVSILIDSYRYFRLREWLSIGIDKSKLLVFLLIFYILWQKVNKMLFCEPKIFNIWSFLWKNDIFTGRRKSDLIFYLLLEPDLLHSFSLLANWRVIYQKLKCSKSENLSYQCPLIEQINFENLIKSPYPQDI